MKRLLRSTALPLLTVLLLLSPMASASAETLARTTGPQATGLIVAPEARLVQQALDASDPIVALAAVVELHHRSRWIDAELLTELTGSLAGSLPDGDARSLARWMHARAAASLDADASGRSLASLGFIERWAIIGPFANEGMAGMSRAFPPETDGYVPDDEHEGRVLPVRWQRTEATGELGYVNLATRVRPTDAAVVYATTDLVNVRPIRATLHLAVDGAYRLWVNGEPVAGRTDDFGGAVVRDRVDVTLDGGRNRILLKIGVDDGDMGFHLRVTDNLDNPIPMLRAEFPETPGPAARSTDDWPTPRGLAERFADLLGGDASGGDPDAEPDPELDPVVAAEPEPVPAHVLAAAAYALRFLQPLDPAEPWERWREEALAHDDLSGHDRARLARVVNDQWRRVELLARAARDGDPWIAIEHAQELAAQMGASRAELARDHLRDLLTAHPHMPEARLLHAQLLWDAGVHYTAFEAALALHNDAPDTPAVNAALRRWAGDLRRDELLPRLFGLAMDREPWDLTAATHLIEMHLASGDLAATQAVLDTVEPWREGDPEIQILRARAARAMDDMPAALLAIEQAIAMRPGDADLFSLLGRLLLESGDRPAAAQAFDEALARAPQSRTLRSWRDRLAPTGDRFYADWQLSPDDVRELADRADTSEGDFTWLADQRMVHVYRNGLATSWVQRAAIAHNRVGVDMLRATNLHYTPDAEVVEILNVRILKPDGRIIESHDARDSAVSTGPSAIYFDVRTRSLYFPALDVGDILLYEYRVSDVAYRNLFDDYFGDVFFIQDHAARALVRYGLLGPASRTFHFNTDQLQLGELTVEDRGDERFHSYVARDIPRVPRESRTPGRSEILEMLSVSTFADWDALANWYWNLIREQLTTSSTMESEVRGLIEGLDTVQDRVAAIHNFVVRNIRYVSLPFGIHGYKPYRTTDCLNRRFGDCKDSAALMKVMLGIAGIHSEIVIIRTRDLGRVDGEPPSLSVFNHAILYVPELDLYLDGTAAHWGSRETPSLDQAASAIIIHDGNGGTFLETPLLPASANLSRTRLDLDLSAVIAGDGQAAGQGHTHLTGEYASPFRRQWEATDQRLERFQNQLVRSIPGITLADIAFGPIDDIEQPASATWTFNGGQWVRPASEGFSLRPFGPNDSSWAQRYASTSERRLPLELDFPFTIEEERTITLGSGATVSSGLGSDEVESPFGHASRTVTLDGDTLTTRLTVRVDRLRIPPDEYPAFRQFLQDVDRLTDQPVRIAREGGSAK